ncbi:extracellular matrix regulator RemB [Metabacillus arenae]|uniref:DUF370 domain-containing protein n=1 Tax=Metabacillus arenae TaxID=2771434 RepID=A0A926N9A8_9BACI|nr:extracellular matrix/biofilm biosynthesis regulator RemA family protein [Metabacillus arenae]MBD1379867.1 DUF370 domain-containing protein [Metabacillus arenae]
MYIHLGDNFVVPSREVVMILDYYSSQASPFYQEFMDRQKSQFVHLSQSEPKSIVITTEHIYFSPLGSSTLKRRSHSMFDPKMSSLKD